MGAVVLAGDVTIKKKKKPASPPSTPLRPVADPARFRGARRWLDLRLAHAHLNGSRCSTSSVPHRTAADSAVARGG